MRLMNLKNGIISLSAAAMLVSCMNDTNEMLDVSGNPEIRLIIEDAASSRTLISGVEASWAEGDRIGIFSGGGYAPFTVNFNEEGYAIAVADGDFELQKGEPIYAFYPYSEGQDPEKARFSIPASQQQSDAEASKLGDNDIVVSRPAVWNGNSAILSFAHAVAFIDFVVFNDANDEDMTVESVEISSDEEIFATEGYIDITKTDDDPDFARLIPEAAKSSIKVTCDAGSTSWNTVKPGESACVRMTVMPAELSEKTLTITFKTSQGETKITTLGREFRAGTAYRFSKYIGWDGTSAEVSGLTYFKFLAKDNDGLYQDIVFEKQADNSYAAKAVYEVDLNSIIPAFDYSGKVNMDGTELESGKTAVNFPEETVIRFDGKKVKFRVDRYYTIPTITIETDGKKPITSKENYLGCTIKFDGKNMYPDYESSVSDSIRGRGNSTWIYYDKKPYRLKLKSKASVAGLKSSKKYVLLANYRDPTHFMNAIAFDMARYMGMRFVNSNRFVDVYLNGDYVGMYQLTEQVAQGSALVDIDEDDGVLISLDYDDGPDGNPGGNDNFYSAVLNSPAYSTQGLPVCVKHPEDLTRAQLNVIRDDFAVIEEYIQDLDYDGLKDRMDVQSYIDFLIIQELTRNVELVTPRSMYMFKDTDNVWTFGPVWDFDAGFAFDWASMSTGHGYFGSQSWLMGSHPGTSNWWQNDAYNTISDFFVNMFNNDDFVADYKARWKEIKDGLLPYCFERLDDYVQHCSEAMKNNAARWPINKSYSTEIRNMRTWLQTRVSNYTSVVNNL